MNKYHSVKIGNVYTCMTDDELEYWNERAAIREHEGGMSKEEAERAAYQELEKRRRV
jgi:hypothetical protein